MRIRSSRCSKNLVNLHGVMVMLVQLVFHVVAYPMSRSCLSRAYCLGCMLVPIRDRAKMSLNVQYENSQIIPGLLYTIKILGVAYSLDD